MLHAGRMPRRRCGMHIHHKLHVYGGWSAQDPIARRRPAVHMTCREFAAIASARCQSVAGASIHGDYHHVCSVGCPSWGQVPVARKRRDCDYVPAVDAASLRVRTQIFALLRTGTWNSRETRPSRDAAASRGLPNLSVFIHGNDGIRPVSLYGSGV